MKALILGADGQMGRALASAAPTSMSLASLGRHDCNISDHNRVKSAIDEIGPDVVFNAAAYTAVDQAEREPQAAHLVNATAVGWIAEATSRAKARLVHISTDFVFDGMSSRPYRPDDQPNPLSVYGRTKLEGERNALSCQGALVVRSSWIYAAAGVNFAQTILRLVSVRDSLRVVADQIGTPTYACSLAQALWSLLAIGASGIHHYTDSGVASWYDFAVAIQEEAEARGMIERAVPITPITTKEYPTPAVRPPFSVLDKSATWNVLGKAAPHWRVNLRRMLDEVKAA